jgi:hypothetical protein
MGACLVALGLFIVQPGTAAASNPDMVACHGTGCRGKDPERMGCSADARTLAIIPHPGTAGAGFNQFVELRFSRRCNARWSRVTSRLAKGDISSTSAFIKGIPSTRVTVRGATLVWSRMWSGAVSACGVSASKSHPMDMPVGCAP